MKKFFSLVLALVMALSLTTIAWADGATEVSTAQDLIDALDAGEDVVFANNIEIAANLSNAYGKTGINVLMGQTIDGAGYTLTVTGANGTWDSAINTTGGTIKNLTIPSGFRGIFINHNSTHSEPVILENVTIDGPVYTISCDQGTNQGLTATNCTFNGWTSFAATVGDVTFNTCSLGEGSGYAYCRPYAPTNFVGCDFDAGYVMDPRDEIALEDCTYDDIPVTESNAARLFNMSDAAAANVSSVTTDSTAALYDLYEGDDDLYLDGAFRTKVAAKKLTKTQAGQVAGWDIEGTFYVEINKSEATNGDYYLTNHGKDKAILYLREAENHGVYTLTGKTYSNFGDDYCGEWNMDPDTTNMYVDADGDFYFAGTQAYMLVGNSVVGVSPASDADYANYYIDHQMEGVYNAKDVLVGVKCVVCGATGTVYASADKAPIGADVYYFDGAPYVLNKVAVKPADTETKVESAETFDAGIAMYVGMSVMAAAGSAVVLKKKD